MRWLNESKGVIASGEQLEPILSNGQVQRGRRIGNTFEHDAKGVDILHRVTPGQIEVQDDDPRVRPSGR